MEAFFKSILGFINPEGGREREINFLCFSWLICLGRGIIWVVNVKYRVRIVLLRSAGDTAYRTQLS
jgi:hypothetical protein